MGSTHLAAEAFDCRIAGRGHRPHRHLGPKATREDGRHLSLRSRLEHGIDRLSHGRRCDVQFNATLMVQALIFDTSPSILEIASNRSFGVISNARHKLAIRVDATAFVPRSDF